MLINSTCNQALPHGIRGSPGCHFHTHFAPSPGDLLSLIMS